MSLSPNAIQLIVVAEKADIRQSDIDSLEKLDQLLCEQLVLFSYVRPANGRVHVRPLVSRAVGAAQSQQALPRLEGWQSPCDTKLRAPCVDAITRLCLVTLCELVIVRAVKERVQMWRELKLQGKVVDRKMGERSRLYRFIESLHGRCDRRD